ncbi:autotransporter domain-containing protein [Pleomorphomonas sp. PLEO]|uniref:autotransporter domain-containing protein n=1 Tax=Pleomorphomonas sp. PLEO TaxID=3239306 RepID=UPI00351DE175
MSGGPVFATCTTTGNVTSSNCDANSIQVLTGSGSSSLTVSDETTKSIEIAPSSTSATPTSQTLTITGATTINRTDYSAVYSETFAPDHTLTVDIAPTVNITAVGGFGAIWLRNDVSGDISVTSAATVTATDGPGITATSNLGHVTVVNNGAVTSTNDRGLYADGSGTTGSPTLVSITNNGTVSAYLAGARAIAYNGTASVTNTGTVTSATRQGLVAWSSAGDVVITNSGTATARDDNAIQALSETGNVTITNSGTLRAYDDTSITDAGSGHNGIQAIAQTSGDVSVTNTLTGDILARDDVAIYAKTVSGTVTVDNAGSVSGLGGISATSAAGNVSVTNSGTITATATSNPVAVALSATGTGSFSNSGTVNGGFTTTGGTNTITNSGTWNLLPSGVTGASWTSTGTTTFTNTGTFDVAGGSATISGLASFVVGNGGLLKVENDGSLSLGSTPLTDDGTLRVVTGGSLTTGAAGIASTGGSNGTAEVAGAGSAWTVDGRLGVGVSGTGTLTVSAGATLTSDNALIGWNAGSTGTVTVSGSGSTWTNANALYLGNGGNGTLNVVTSGQVTSGETYIAAGAGSTGSLVVSGSGSKFTDTGMLYVGYAGSATGSLAISGGGTVVDTRANIADGIGSSGSATIAGNGSTWTNSGALYVGGGGVGTMTVSAGGTVTSTIGAIGNLASSSTSSVRVTGAGSSWTTSDELFVGLYGNATLAVDSAGTLTSAGAVIGRHSTSSATVSGSGSSWSTGAISIGGDAADPGTAGNGTLAISTGGTVTSTTARLGDVAGSTGTATISGSGSTWTLSDRIGVGTSGTGSLTVSAGGTVSSTGGIVGWNSTGTGTALITGSGSRWANTGVLYIGNQGDGTLTVSAGGAVTSTDGYVATESGSTSSATITGSGSAWTMSGDLLVGHNTGSNGTITISAGGSVSSLQAILGDLAGSSGTMVLTGEGSSMVASSDFNVGRFGTGSLTLTGGATLSSNRSYLGNEAGSSGTVVMSGAGTTWTTTGRLFVGTDGDGTLTISDGATIVASGLVIGWGSTSTGVLNVGAAAGDAAVAAGTLDVPAITFGSGNGRLVFNFTGSDTVAAQISGAGSLELYAGALTLSGANSYSRGTTVSGGTLTLGSSTAAGTGTITLAGTSTLAYTDGITVANAIDVTGTATLTIASGRATQSGAITGTGTYVVTGDGTLYLTGSSAGFTGTTSVDNGTLSVNGTLGGGVEVNSEGTLKGSGTVASVTVQSGGTIAPGNSIGTLTITGNYVQSAGSTYSVELGASGASDRIVVGGTAALAGSVSVASTSSGYSIGSRYTILTAAGGISGAYTSFNGTLSLFATAALDYDANAVYIDVTKSRTFASAAATRNQIATAAALDTIDQGGTLASAVAATQTVDDAQRTFDLLSGELHASLAGQMITDTRIVESVAIDRIRTAFDTVASSRPASTEPTSTDLTMWSRALGSWSRASGDGNSAGLSSALGGFLVGGDAPVFNGDVRVGILAGYARGHASEDGLSSEADTNDYHLGVYGGRQWGALGLRTGATLTVRDFATTRSISTSTLDEELTAHYTGTTGRVFGELGYGIHLDAANLEPFLGADYVHGEIGDHSEQGGAAALTTDSWSSDLGYTTLGMRASKDITVSGSALTLRGSLAWRHAFGDTTPSLVQRFVGSSPFSVSGVAIARDALAADVGLDVEVGRSATLGVSYGGQFGNRVTEQTARADFKWKF